MGLQIKMIWFNTCFLLFSLLIILVQCQAQRILPNQNKKMIVKRVIDPTSSSMPTPFKNTITSEEGENDRFRKWNVMKKRIGFNDFFTPEKPGQTKPNAKHGVDDVNRSKKVKTTKNSKDDHRIGGGSDHFHQNSEYEEMMDSAKMQKRKQKIGNGGYSEQMNPDPTKTPVNGKILHSSKGGGEKN